jgi:2-polyprenyl-3-methyl-5-hydroxy-6-metoxy-1,4-benzoquinol methylase
MFPRSTQKEIMDDVFINDERIDQALGELTVINRWLGGFSTSRKGVETLLKRIPKAKTVSVLDVGAGGSDLVAAVSTLHPGIHITALDLNKRACEYSQKKYPTISVVHGSVLDLPFDGQSFDIVHASLFLHHFSDNELRFVFKALYTAARFGIIINDLRRSVFSYYAIMLLTRLFSRSAMVKNDAPISVRRGFTRDELVRLCSALPSATYTIRRMWAFRWNVCIAKPL